MYDDDFDIDDNFDDIVSATRQSRFMTKEQIGPPGAIIELTFAKAGRAQVDFGDSKGLHLETLGLFKEEGYKPLIIRPVNAALIAQILGTKDPREWAGRRIGLKHDPLVMMAGKVTGGIRACPPSQEKNGGSRARRGHRSYATTCKPVPANLRKRAPVPAEQTEDIPVTEGTEENPY